MHILDDFRLQGILASMKQKSWWKEQKEYKDMYQCDYLMALAMHSFSWAFMIMLPVAIKQGFDITPVFSIVFSVNMVIHFIVDDLKANKRKINLVTDQLVHLIQILITSLIF
jgi:hypothetical protein